MEISKMITKWRCRICGTLWDESQTYDDPIRTAIVHTCGNLLCGAMCDKVEVI